ncbi:MAG: hypothetical protein IPK87_06600 [Planctomycetes bacterium]|nr:hypothetical protein [Planctomycetota bacterium]
MDGTAQIAVSGDELLIERLLVRSSDLCRYIEAFLPNEHADRVRDALIIGAEVLVKARARSEVDYIDSRFAQVSKEFSEQLNQVVAGTTSGLSNLMTETKTELGKLLNPRGSDSPLKERFEALDKLIEEIKKELKDEHAKVLGSTQALSAQFDINGGETSHLAKLKGHITEFENKVKALFDPEGSQSSYAVKLKQQLDGIFSDAGTLPKLLDSRLAFGEPTSPFGKFKTDVDAKLGAMREKIVESIGELKTEVESYRSQTDQAAADREKMSHKGDDFEEAAFDLLTPFAQKRGDTVERVGTEAESGSNKKGDLNYRFSGNGGLVAIEAKNKKIDSIPKFTKELLAAVRNRSAGFGILVVRDVEHLQTSIGDWHFDVSPEGIGYIFTHSGLLELSLKFAHARLRYAAAEVAGVDASALKVLIGAVEKKLKDASNIRRNLTDIENTVGAIRGQIDEMTGEIKSHMEKIGEEIGKAQTGG